MGFFEKLFAPKMSNFEKQQVQSMRIFLIENHQGSVISNSQTANSTLERFRHTGS